MQNIAQLQRRNLRTYSLGVLAQAFWHARTDQPEQFENVVPLLMIIRAGYKPDSCAASESQSPTREFSVRLIRKGQAPGGPTPASHQLPDRLNWIDLIALCQMTSRSFSAYLLKAERTMKALIRDRYGPPDVLEIRDIERPAPKEREVLLRVHAASINDWDWQMLQRPMLSLGAKTPRVRILGSDVAGRDLMSAAELLSQRLV